MFFLEYSLKAAGKKIHASFVKIHGRKSPYWDIPSTRASSAAITFRTLLPHQPNFLSNFQSSSSEDGFITVRKS
jgi:hypothetical protein